MILYKYFPPDRIDVSGKSQTNMQDKGYIEETIFDVTTRPVILDGIDAIVTRGDLPRNTHAEEESSRGERKQRWH